MRRIVPAAKKQTRIIVRVRHGVDVFAIGVWLVRHTTDSRLATRQLCAELLLPSCILYAYIEDWIYRTGLYQLSKHSGAVECIHSKDKTDQIETFPDYQ